MPEISLFRHAENQRTLAAGEVLCSEGDLATEMWAVLEGEIEVTRAGTPVETVGPGGIVGEVALLADHIRVASGRATQPTTVAVVSESEFLRIVKLNPFFSIEVMRFMAERLLRDGGRTVS